MRKFIVFFFLCIFIFALTLTCFAAPFEIVLPDYSMIPLMDIPLGSYNYTISINNESVSGVSTMYYGDLSIDRNPALPSYYMPMTIDGLPFVFVGQLHDNYISLALTINGESIPIEPGERVYFSFDQIINPPLEDSVKSGLSSVIDYIRHVVVYIFNSPIFSLFIVAFCVSLLILSIKFIKVF